MKEIDVVVYTMKGCPHCDDFKNLLEERNIDFHDRDIDKYKDEYDLFVEASGSEYVPSLLVLETSNKITKSFIYVPEKNYNELTEAIDIILEHKTK